MLAYLFVEQIHARIQKVCQRGQTLTTFFFLVDEGRKDPDTTIRGQSSARRRNAILMAFRRRADDGTTWNSGLVALCFFRGSGPALLRNTIFRGGVGSGPLAPSGFAHVITCACLLVCGTLLCKVTNLFLLSEMIALHHKTRSKYKSPTHNARK